MWGNLQYLFELKRTRIVFGILIDIVVMGGNLLAIILVNEADTKNVEYCLLIFIATICLIGIYNFSWYLIMFYEIKKDGFLIFSSTTRYGLRGILISLFIMNEVMLMKICVYLMAYYNIFFLCKKNYELSNNIKQLFLMNNISLYVLLFNIYLILVMLISSVIKDKSMVYLLVNVGMAAISYFGIKKTKMINYWNNIFVKIICFVLLILLFLLLLEMAVKQLKRGEIVVKED